MIEIFFIILKGGYQEFGWIGIIIILLGGLIMVSIFDWLRRGKNNGNGSDSEKVDVVACSKHRKDLYEKDSEHGEKLAKIQERLKDLPEMRQDIKSILIGVSKLNGRGGE